MSTNEAMVVSMPFTVTPEDTAAALGSGDLAVLATPRLVAWCEAATCAAAAPRLGAGDPAGSAGASRTSVGVRVVIDHLVASAVGDRVVVSAELLAQVGRELVFRVTAVDATPGRVDHAGEVAVEPGVASSAVVLARGEVRRVVVDTERFLGRLARR